MSGLCTLREFQFDHLHLRTKGILPVIHRAESSVLITATEITDANLPDQVSTLEVIIANASFAGVVRKASEFSAFIQRKYGRLTECTVAHTTNVEDAGMIWLTALLVAYPHSQILVINLHRIY